MTKLTFRKFLILCETIGPSVASGISFSDPLLAIIFLAHANTMAFHYMRSTTGRGEFLDSTTIVAFGEWEMPSLVPFLQMGALSRSELFRTSLMIQSKLKFIIFNNSD